MKANTTKTKSMTCFPGPEKVHIADHTYTLMLERGGLTQGERQRRRIVCEVCKKDMLAGYLITHLRQIHGSYAMNDSASLSSTLNGNAALFHSVTPPP
jgi:hypothetical protein